MFRALRGAAPEDQARGVALLAARLPDLPLVAPTLALARELRREAALVEALVGAGAAKDAWCSLRQAATLLRAAGEPARGLELLAGLLRDEAWDPTPLALEGDPVALVVALKEGLRLRLQSAARRRDRTSSALARGVARALAALAPDDPEVPPLLAQVVAAEARRTAMKDEPALALEALAGLAAAPPLQRLRLLGPLLGVVDRPKVRSRIEEALEAAAAAIGAGPEERVELLARTGGLEADGWARVPLDEGGEVRLRPAADGTIERESGSTTSPRLAAADARAVEAAERELAAAREDLIRRLEQVLVHARAWPVRLWRAIFLGGHPLWADLARRCLWELRGTPARAFELGDGGPEDVFGGPVALPDDGLVGLTHPVTLERDELELWRERALERAQTDPRRAEPFPQRFRAVVVASEPVSALARFAGREAHKQTLGELARRSGWTGFPLPGSPPWELTRTFSRSGASARLVVEDAPVPVAPPPPKGRRPALTGERELDEDAAFGPSRDPRARARRGPPEAAPRVKVASVTLEARPGADLKAPLAELVRDLEALTDPLATVDASWLRGWAQRKWRDEKESWREVVLRYRLGSPALVEVRKLLVGALARAAGSSVRLEDRFVITRTHVLELGTGFVHEGPAKDHVPPWKVDELLAGRLGETPRLPLEPAADPETHEIVSRALALARLDVESA